MGLGFVVVHATSEAVWAAGREVVLDTSELTGYPDPAVWPRHVLGQHTSERQARAESVWATSAYR